MVASGRASVFILRAKTQTIIKVLCLILVNKDHNFHELGLTYYFHNNTQAWDHAVGMICVHEAGGQVCDYLLKTSLILVILYIYFRPKSIIFY